MTSVMLVDDSLRNDIHNSMILISTTLGLVATSFLSAGIFFLVKTLRNCPAPEPCPPCTPYQASCSTACVGCPTSCTVTCYSCQSGKTKGVSVVAVGSTETPAPTEVTVQVV